MDGIRGQRQKGGVLACAPYDEVETRGGGRGTGQGQWINDGRQVAFVDD